MGDSISLCDCLTVFPVFYYYFLSSMLTLWVDVTAPFSCWFRKGPGRQRVTTFPRNIEQAVEILVIRAENQVSAVKDG